MLEQDRLIKQIEDNGRLSETKRHRDISEDRTEKIYRATDYCYLTNRDNFSRTTMTCLVTSLNLAGSPLVFILITIKSNSICHI